MSGICSVELAFEDEGAKNDIMDPVKLLLEGCRHVFLAGVGNLIEVRVENIRKFARESIGVALEFGSMKARICNCRPFCVA